MTWLIVVDSNEQAHYARREVDRADFLAQRTGHAAEARAMACGDYALVWRDAEGAERCVALWERKAAQDMAASIVDGRYRDQASRMEASGAPWVYWAVIDGTLRRPEDEGRVDAAVAHLSVSYPRTRVLRLRNGDAAFATALTNVARYLHDTLHNDNALAAVPLHSVVQEAGARPHLDEQAVVWREQLTVPRGMSRKTAEAVTARYPTALSLLRAYARTARDFRAPEPKARGKKRTVDDALDEMLEDVDIGGGKRLAKARSRIIRQTLVPDRAELAAIGDC